MYIDKHDLQLSVLFKTPPFDIKLNSFNLERRKIN